MKLFVMAVLFGAAVWSFPTMAAGTTDNFDGKWTATTKPVVGVNCALAGAVIRHDFTVRNGRIDGAIKAGFGRHKLTGLIQSDGTVKDFGTVGVLPWSFTGKFGKDRAAGNFVGSHCGGKFLFLRKSGG